MDRVLRLLCCWGFVCACWGFVCCAAQHQKHVIRLGSLSMCGFLAHDKQNVYTRHKVSSAPPALLQVSNFALLTVSLLFSDTLSHFLHHFTGLQASRAL